MEGEKDNLSTLRGQIELPGIKSLDNKIAFFLGIGEIKGVVWQLSLRKIILDDLIKVIIDQDNPQEVWSKYSKKLESELHLETANIAHKLVTDFTNIEPSIVKRWVYATTVLNINNNHFYDNDKKRQIEVRYLLLKGVENQDELTPNTTKDRLTTISQISDRNQLVHALNQYVLNPAKVV